MARPKHAIPHRTIEHSIPEPLLTRFESLLCAPGNAKPAIGLRARTINRLILKFVEEREHQGKQRPSQDG
ncbi:MAG: hypothetical protein HC883_01375 [Bdellovibrionaceae bacterium]|nr:hypothetical protein [Pseudobdellovibrionaceae bacterium]